MQVVWSPSLGNAVREMKLLQKVESPIKDLKLLELSSSEKEALTRSMSQNKNSVSNEEEPFWA